MTNMRDSLLRDLVLEGTEDYVGIWEIIHDLYDNRSDIDEKMIQDRTLSIIKSLLEKEWMDIGSFEENNQGKLEFKTWYMGVDQIMKKIKSDWDSLNRLPSMGEIGWLIATEKGENLIKQ